MKDDKIAMATTACCAKLKSDIVTKTLDGLETYQKPKKDENPWEIPSHKKARENDRWESSLHKDYAPAQSSHKEGFGGNAPVGKKPGEQQGLRKPLGTGRKADTSGSVSIEKKPFTPLPSPTGRQPDGCFDTLTGAITQTLGLQSLIRGKLQVRKSAQEDAAPEEDRAGYASKGTLVNIKR